MSVLAQLPASADTLAVVACFALTAAVLIYVFLIEPDPADSAPHRSHLDGLLERRDTIYDNLRDLKFEHRAGKFVEQDFEEMQQLLETEAALVLAEIETATGNPEGALRRAPGAASPAPGPGRGRG